MYHSGMKEPVSIINIEEKIGKTVGRRKPPTDPLRTADGLQRALTEGQIIREVNGVPIPFASPKMLYKMKELTHREKDRGDLQFLRENYAEEIFGDESDQS